MKVLLIPIMLASLATCGDERLSLLQGMDKARGTAAYLGFCEQPVACDQPGGTCSRVHGHKGASCLQRANMASGTATPTEMRRLTELAETAFGESARLGGEKEALAAGTGRAEALELRRSFSPTSAAAAINAELEATAGQLAPLPGGSPFAGYYRAGVTQHRVLAVKPGPGQCADLQAALALLPEAPTDPELAERVRQRRAALTAALKQPARACS